MTRESKKEFIARRVARELKDGDYVNLGSASLPCRQLRPEGITVVLHSENGLLGIGPYPFEGEEDADLINAGKETVTEIPGSSYFSSADCLPWCVAAILDVAVIGAMEVDEKGNPPTG